MELFKNTEDEVRNDSQKSKQVRISELTYQCVVVENNLFLELLLLIDAEFAVDGDLSSVLSSSNLVLLDVLLIIFSYVLLILTVFLSLAILLVIFVLLVILDISMLLSVVVTDRTLLGLIKMLLLIPPI